MVFDAEIEQFIEVQPYCRCGEVFRDNGLGHPYCIHCDRVCVEEVDCPICEPLNKNWKI